MSHALVCRARAYSQYENSVMKAMRERIVAVPAAGAVR